MKLHHEMNIKYLSINTQPLKLVNVCRSTQLNNTANVSVPLPTPKALTIASA